METNNPNLNDLAGNYGPDWLLGVLIEHIARFEGTGAFTLRFDADGYASIRQGDVVVPVRCGELVAWSDEDGPTVIRCGAPVNRDSVRTYGACEGHHAERAEWMAMSEAEKAAWERDHYAV